MFFKDDKRTKILLSLPQIHCSSCIWLLENLHRLHKGIEQCTVQFTRREALITFKHQEIKFSAVLSLLSSIGYQPNVLEKSALERPKQDKKLIYQIGLAGFCFGNIMLFSFPEYLGIDESYLPFTNFFNYLIFLLSVPVILYGGMPYLSSAYLGLKRRYVNMDVPIALGIVALYLRSTYEMFFLGKAGYMDSLAGLIFFLLLGKWFQQRTYRVISFDRDYKSYFPIAVTKLVNGEVVFCELEQLSIGDTLQIRSKELVPADAILQSSTAILDYSFVTGESDSVALKKGDVVYAGGRIVGAKAELVLSKTVNNSYLTQLWNQEVFQKGHPDKSLGDISSKVGYYFTLFVLLLSVITAIYWQVKDPSLMWNTLSAVLIVACPCALALSVPFTLGNVVRILGKEGLFVKNTSVLEGLSKITILVFDKTGTLTLKEDKNSSYQGFPLSHNEKQMLSAVLSNSVHPLSITLNKLLSVTSTLPVVSFEEHAGKGIQAFVNGQKVLIGSSEFLNISHQNTEVITGATVHISIGGFYKGVFIFKQAYRQGLAQMIVGFKKSFKIHLLSGDNSTQKHFIKEQFGITEQFYKQSPMDKLLHIKQLQEKGENVLMLGDGLNDAGALKQSNIGIAVSDSIHQFSPACDAILQAQVFHRLPYFLSLAKAGVFIVYLSFAISFLYNAIGFAFALSAQLSPIVAAILMPLSSITVVLFASLASSFAARLLKK